MKLSTGSLRFRVFAVGAAGVTLLCLVLTASFGWYFVTQSENHLSRKASAITNLLHENIATPMDVDAAMQETQESEEAVNILKTAAKDENFQYAIVFRKDGSTFAKTGNVPQNVFSQRKTIKKDTQISEKNALHSVQLVKIDDKKLGTIFLGYSKKQVQDDSRKIIFYGTIFSILATIVFTLLLFVVLSNIVVKPILRITKLMKRLGKRDLRPFDDQRGIGTNVTELVDMYRALTNSTMVFRNYVQSINDSSNALFVTSNHIMESSTELSEVATEQAAAVSETTVTIEEVERTGHLTAQSARNIENTASKTQQMSQEGLAAVDDTKMKLLEIQAQVEEIVESAKKLNEELDEVDRIVASVAGVTQQSHTLSINASIEAAKAGDAGRGFAVVANQIRDLSQQSREATEQVRRTLTGIQNSIYQIMRTNEVGLKTAKQGVSSIERTGEVIRRLGGDIDNSTGAAQKIAENTLQQATGLEQTARAMSGINEATKHTLNNIDAMKKSGEELRGYAAAMEVAVDMFKMK